MTKPRVLISVRLRARLMHVLRDMARKNDTSVTDVVETLLVEALKTRGVNVDIASPPNQ
jgi:hypothetical protein